jgi:hypothetical protein
VISLTLCVVALVATYMAARRSLGRGVGVLLAVGYLYGIVRANQLNGYSHLLFDAALLGLYAARLFNTLPTSAAAAHEMRFGCSYHGWPLCPSFRGRTSVEVVGLRGNVSSLPPADWGTPHP